MAAKQDGDGGIVGEYLDDAEEHADVEVLLAVDSALPGLQTTPELFEHVQIIAAATQRVKRILRSLSARLLCAAPHDRHHLAALQQSHELEAIARGLVQLLLHGAGAGGGEQAVLRVGSAGFGLIAL